MNAVPPRRPRLTSTDLVDEALDCCANVRTLAELLEAGAAAPESAFPNATVISRTGYLIGQEAGKLHELVWRLDEALAKAECRR